jgi:hypothetical protein
VAKGQSLDAHSSTDRASIGGTCKIESVQRDMDLMNNKIILLSKSGTKDKI